MKNVKLLILIFYFTGFFLSSNLAFCFTIIPENCRKNVSSCQSSGELDWVLIFSDIVRSDEKFFIELDSKWPPDKPFPLIWVDSPGGDVDSAIKIGRILRKRYAIIISGNPILGVDPLNCISSCSLLAAGAVERHIKLIGLHSPHYVKKQGRRGETYKDADEELLKEIRDYMAEMGIDPFITNTALNTPSEDLKIFTFNPSVDPLEQEIVNYGFYQLSSRRPDLPNLPVSNKGDTRTIEEEWSVAALNGDLLAAHMLSDHFEVENSRKKPDYKKAEYWLQYAVDQGDSTAMHNMAVALVEGHWGRKDKKRALELYKRAAILGSGASQNNLGWHYYTGNGVKRNVAQAIYWISLSAHQGTNFAYGSLCEMYGNGDVLEKDDITAYLWCDQALKTMPKGAAKDASIRAMNKITPRMSLADIKEAMRRSKEWKPIGDHREYMGNKEDW